MIPAQIIAAKRDGGELTDSQIEFFIQGYARDEIPDYQMSALAMAIYLNGMTARETATLTQQMLDSGERLQWPGDGFSRVDKHSTGGVGDKISIPLAPLLMGCRLQVPMLSGRGLGATGGTLDKLEAILGFRTDLSLQEIHQLTQKVGGVITGASEELAPADRRLYALRDVTATVPSIPLITASIMSKKLAESLDALVLDVKCGSGAFMKTIDGAQALALSLVETGRRMGVRTSALITDMSQPLGRMCGNAVEILESIDVLKGGGPPDVRELTLQLAAELLVTSGTAAGYEKAMETARSCLDSGRAFEKFEQMVAAQGGAADFRPDVAPAHDVLSESEGIVSDVATEALGLTIIAMGGGRRKKSDSIDHSTGIEMLVRIGDPVEVGQPLARIFTKAPAQHVSFVRQAITIGETVPGRPLILKKIEA
ncbi:MAG: thymidine phosphorylase [Planctomycetaceae bacterium]|nr:thymidine phosphorylase [Planctomycetaceae bacterium]